jgi:hypothetical protein
VNEDGNFYSCYFKTVDTPVELRYYSTISIESATSAQDEEIQIVITIFYSENEFNSPGERFVLSVPVAARANFDEFTTFTYNSFDTTFYKFDNLGAFGEK